ncbi:MAG: MFS transporter [Mycobacteriales bacterium]
MTEIDSEPAQADTGAQGWLSRGVVSVGAASFCSDAGHEIATSVLPSFLTATLHAGPGALGAIEGTSDALVGLSKLAGGPLSNDPVRRARLATGGYLGTALATGAIGFAVTVWQVAALRALAWASRGIRSPARDTLLTSLVPSGAYGRAFGVERTGDNAGAIVGPLLAAALVSVVGVRHAIWFAVVPGLFAALAITVAAREARRTVASSVGRRTLSLNLGELRRAGLVRALAPAALFEFGNIATTFLILRATGLLHTDGRSLAAAASIAILLYAAHNAAATVAALGGGHLVDRLGPRVVFAAAGSAYVLGYGLFAVDQHAWPILLLGFLLAGVGIGLGETAESTLVAQTLPDRLRGNGFGVLGLVQSLGDLASSVVVGLLWAAFSATVGFAYAAIWMLASVVCSRLLRPPQVDAAVMLAH